MIAAGICSSFLFEILQGGVHAPTDDYRIALYSRDAHLTPDTTAYSTLAEVIGQGGYEAGGQKLLQRAVMLDRGVALMNWADPLWPRSTITARAALIYNFSKQNRAVTVIDLGKDFVSTNGSFTITFPPATSETALVAIG